MQKLYSFEARTGAGHIVCIQKRAVSAKNAERAAMKVCKEGGLSFVGKWHSLKGSASAASAES